MALITVSRQLASIAENTQVNSSPWCPNYWCININIEVTGMKNIMSYENSNRSVKHLVLLCLFNAKKKLFLPFCGIVLFTISLAGKHKLILDTDALFVLQAHSYVRLSSVLPTAIQLPLECEERSSELARVQAHSSLIIYNLNFLAIGSDYWMYLYTEDATVAMLFYKKKQL